jgi:hypothetical protein
LQHGDTRERAPLGGGAFCLDSDFVALHRNTARAVF